MFKLSFNKIIIISLLITMTFSVMLFIKIDHLHKSIDKDFKTTLNDSINIMNIEIPLQNSRENRRYTHELYSNFHSVYILSKNTTYNKNNNSLSKAILEVKNHYTMQIINNEYYYNDITLYNLLLDVYTDLNNQENTINLIEYIKSLK